MDNQDQTAAKEQTPVKRTFTINKDSMPNYDQISAVSKPNKILFLIIVLILTGVVTGGFMFNKQIKTLVSGNNPVSSPTSVPAEQPASTPNPLIRADWSFEVLNGSGVSGLAKKIAAQLQSLGYQVVKTGNASKSYAKTEILSRKDSLAKIDLVIADIKDVIKIATVSGELTEGTASARIIIGKDSI